MKQCLSFAVLLLCLQVVAQNESYRGGAGDGAARVEQVTAFPSSLSYSPFFGGAGDGHAFTELVTPLPLANNLAPYIGGIGDGYTLVEMVTPLPFANNFSPFFGGNGDGDASNNLISQVFAFPPHFYAFFGGSNDGWAGNLLPGVVILPVTLFQFRGEEVNGRHRLIWKTEQEINTSHFEIERSSSNAGFRLLEKKAARGNYSGQTEYSIVDSVPLKGKNFYRLKMFDRDGSFKYSPTILLENKNGLLTIVVYPNPVMQMLNIKLNRVVNSPVTWTVYDVAGKRLMAQQTPGNYGQYAVNVASLPSGVYVLEVITAHGKETIQFTKQ